MPARIALTVAPREAPWSATIRISRHLEGGYVPPDGVALRLFVRYPGNQLGSPLLALRTNTHCGVKIEWNYHAGRRSRPTRSGSPRPRPKATTHSPPTTASPSPSPSAGRPRRRRRSASHLDTTTAGGPMLTNRGAQGTGGDDDRRDPRRARQPRRALAFRQRSGVAAAAVCSTKAMKLAFDRASWR